MSTVDVAGYWTGSFEGTNSGGVSMTIDRHGNVLGGVASMHEPTLGSYQYVVSGQLGTPIRLLLNPATESLKFGLGVINATCALQSDGSMKGLWQSSIGTSGVFNARRYQDSAASNAEKPKRRNVFVSYCHVDSTYLNDLLVHLKPLERAGLIDAWSDQRIKAGSLWKKEIEEALANAHVAVLLVSADFLASDFIINNELPMLLSKAREAGLRILPVILRTCRFTRDPQLNIFQSINDPKAPLASLEGWQREKFYDQIAHEIESFSG